MEEIRLEKNQLVLFENGYKAERAEVAFSHKHKAFCLVTDETDENGNRIKLYSTTIIDKPIQAKKRPFVPNKGNCTVEIFPIGETEKAYQIPDGSNGKIGHCKEYYRYIAKSICYVDDSGRIFAPMWAYR